MNGSKSIRTRSAVQGRGWAIAVAATMLVTACGSDNGPKGARANAASKSAAGDRPTSNTASEQQRLINVEAREWIKRAEEIVRTLRPTPPAQARLYAATAGVFADVAASSKREHPEHEAATATVSVIRHILGEEAAKVESMLPVNESAEPLSAESQGILDAYVGHLDSDANVDVRNGVIPEDLPEGSWVKKSANGPFDPDAGDWTYWLATNGAAHTGAVPVPPAVDSAEYGQELAAVHAAVRKRNASWTAAINRWGGAPGTQGPGGIWLDRLVDQLGESEYMNDPSFAANQAILAKSIADAFIAAWDVKYRYWTERPDMADASIEVAMENPPFPGYVSGHSTISAAAATVLESLYPKYASVFWKNAEEARDSRLYAGIHFPIDNSAGFALGSAIGHDALRSLESSGGAIKAETAADEADDSSDVPSPPLLDADDTASEAEGWVPFNVERYKDSGVVANDASPAGALISVTNEELGVGFVAGVEADVIPALRYQPGWKASVVSDDATWTPGACGGTPNVLIAGRFEATVEVEGGVQPDSDPAYEGVAPPSQKVRIFDIQKNEFFDIATKADGLPAVAGDIGSVGNNLIVIRSETGSAWLQIYDLLRMRVKTTEIQLPANDWYAYLGTQLGLLVNGQPMPLFLGMNSGDSLASKGASIAPDGAIGPLVDEISVFGPETLTEPFYFAPGLQLRQTGAPNDEGAFDWELLDDGGRQLRLLTEVWTPEYKGDINGYAVITFRNATETPGILREQAMFFDRDTGDWHRVFDLGVEVPGNQVPLRYSGYDAEIFVAGGFKLG